MVKNLSDVLIFRVRGNHSNNVGKKIQPTDFNVIRIIENQVNEKYRASTIPHRISHFRHSPFVTFSSPKLPPSGEALHHYI